MRADGGGAEGVGITEEVAFSACSASKSLTWVLSFEGPAFAFSDRSMYGAGRFPGSSAGRLEGGLGQLYTSGCWLCAHALCPIILVS